MSAGPIQKPIESIIQYSFERQSFNIFLIFDHCICSHTKMSWIIILLALLFKCASSISVIERFDSIVKNDAPIIGVMVQESLVPHIKYKTYIAASYIKYVEGSGARAVPIW